MHIYAYAFLTSFLVSTFLLQWYQHPSYFFVFLGLFGILGTVSILKKVIIASAITGVIIALTAVAYTTHIPSLGTLDTYATKQRIALEGVISAEPDRRPMQTKYTIKVDTLTDGSGTIIPGLRGQVLVTDRRQWPEYQFGDRVRVRGELEKPEQIDMFAYHNYLSRYDIYSVMYRGSLENITRGNASIRRKLYALKASFEYHINRIFPEPHASFMAGLLTGSRKGIPEDLMEDFNTTGLTHIIAISGYNISIIISIISSMLFWLPRTLRIYPATAAIIAFTIFVGASAAVVRAAIMGILGLLALQFGRANNIRLTILWTAFCMIAWNPKILWYDAGFQLSFLAVLGLTELSPLMDRWFAKVPETLAMRESLQMTMAAQLSAVPLIVLLFGRLSLVAPLANLLTAPLLPMAMLFGAIATLTGYVYEPLALLLAYPAWACLEFVIYVAAICAAIPFASVNMQISIIALVLYYVLVLLWVTTHRAKAPSGPAAMARA